MTRPAISRIRRGVRRRGCGAGRGSNGVIGRAGEMPEARFSSASVLVIKKPSRSVPERFCFCGPKSCEGDHPWTAAYALRAGALKLLRRFAQQIGQVAQPQRLGLGLIRCARSHGPPSWRCGMAALLIPHGRAAYAARAGSCPAQPQRGEARLSQIPESGLRR
jgi:hypothetical protein